MPSQQTQPARSRHPKCSSLCADAYASPSPAPASMSSGITVLHAPAVACWRDEPRSSSARGCGSLARRLALKAALCLNSGFCTPPRLGSRPKPLGFVLCGAASRCAAMSRPCHLCARTGCRSREVAIVTARPSKSRGAGNSHGTLSKKLARPGPLRLVVLASEVGGRWGSEAHDLLRRLVRARSLRAPPVLRASVHAAVGCWSGTSYD